MYVCVCVWVWVVCCVRVLWSLRLPCVFASVRYLQMCRPALTWVFPAAVVDTLAEVLRKVKREIKIMDEPPKSQTYYQVVRPTRPYLTKGVAVTSSQTLLLSFVLLSFCLGGLD